MLVKTNFHNYSNSEDRKELNRYMVTQVAMCYGENIKRRRTENIEVDFDFPDQFRAAFQINHK